MPAVTKTLELHLVDPNSHKERKLRETKETYQRALQAAFDGDCTTQSAANDVVVEYDLSGYAKNALKQYVPQLCGDSYDAADLHDEQPVKFTKASNSTTNRRTTTSGTRKSPITTTTSFGCLRRRIPNTARGWKRCTRETPKWARVGCSNATGSGICTLPRRERSKHGRRPT